MSLIEDVIAIAKKLREVSKKVRDAELQGLIADLTLKIVELKGQLAQLAADNLDLRRQIDQLRQTADVRSKLKSQNGVYYLAQSVAGCEKGHFCPTCLDADGLLIRLKRTYRTRLSQGTTVPHGWACDRCGNQRAQKS